MNSILVVIAVLGCTIISAQNTPDKVGADCAAKFPIPQPEKDAIGQGMLDKVTNDGKCFIDCFSKGMGFVADGKLVEAPLVSFFTTGGPKFTADAVKAAVGKCQTSFTGANDCEKSFNAHKCVVTALGPPPKA